MSCVYVQAEIDSAAELIDFYRFNCYFTKELLRYQPISERPEETLNLMRYMSLEGFIASISPFNFTAIAGNLAFTPTIMVRKIGKTNYMNKYVVGFQTKWSEWISLSVRHCYEVLHMIILYVQTYMFNTFSHKIFFLSEEQPLQSYFAFLTLVSVTAAKKATTTTPIHSSVIYLHNLSKF